MEIHCGLVGGGEERGRYILPTELTNHRARIEGPVAYLEEIMVGLGGEVQELHVGSWEKERERREKHMKC